MHNSFILVPCLSEGAGKKKKSQKKARVWEGQIAKNEMESLDYSAKQGPTTDEEAAAMAAQLADPSKLGTKNKDGIYEVQDVDEPEDDGEDESEDESGKTKSSGGGVFSYLKSMTSQREITAETLDPVLVVMREQLVKKNVASNIADHLCQSVKSNLLGKKIGTFERKYSTTFRCDWLT